MSSLLENVWTAKRVHANRFHVVNSSTNATETITNLA